MPEPNTLSAAPEGPDPSPGSTAGWVPEPASEPVADATRTQLPRSTPGPHDASRKTPADDTERMGDGSAPGEMPRIAGLRVEKLVGKGGMGRVYRAVHLELNKVVALKLITTSGRDEELARGRFEREVRALARIEHPNIVPIYHAGQWHGFPYFTMKYVPGGALSQHLERFTGDPTACAKLVAKVARAVQALHDAGVVHRDLKPLNILVGDGDEPLVADFGLAKWLDDPSTDLTASFVPLGTRQYMAPEQTTGVRGGYSRACDIWALGITLYELLAGARPFPDDGSTDLYERIRTADPPPLPDSVPDGLASIVGRCLAKKPADRYPSAAAVATDLDRLAAGEAISPPPVRHWHPPVWARALGVFALMALIVLPAVLIPWNRTDDPERQPPVRPVAVPMTVADQLTAGRKVFLTDAKGKPAFPLTKPPGHEILEADNVDGDHVFISHGLGVGELIDEVLPLPVRLDADLEVLVGPKIMTLAGVSVAGRHWAGTKVDSQSVVRLLAGPDLGLGTPPSLRCRAQGHWWPNVENPGGVTFRLGIDQQLQVNKVPADGVWKTTISVDIYPASLIPTFDGKPFAPITPERMLTEIQGWVGTPDVLADFGKFDIQGPAFGTGIGITLDSAQAVVRNMTLTPLMKQK